MDWDSLMCDITLGDTELNIQTEAEKNLEVVEREWKEEENDLIKKLVRSENETKMWEQLDNDIGITKVQCFYGWPKKNSLTVPAIEDLPTSICQELWSCNMLMGTLDSVSRNELRAWIMHDVFRKYNNSPGDILCQMLFRIISLHPDTDIVCEAFDVFEAFILNREQVSPMIIADRQMDSNMSTDLKKCWSPNFDDFCWVLKHYGFRDNLDNDTAEYSSEQACSNSMSDNMSSSGDLTHFPLTNFEKWLQILQICLDVRCDSFETMDLRSLFRILCKMRLDEQVFESSVEIESVSKCVASKFVEREGNHGIEALAELVVGDQVSSTAECKLVLIESFRTHEQVSQELTRLCAFKLFLRLCVSSVQQSQSENIISPSTLCDYFEKHVDFDDVSWTDRNVQKASLKLKLCSLALGTISDIRADMKGYSRFLKHLSSLQSSVDSRNPLKDTILSILSSFQYLIRPSRSLNL
eukprot:36662_1